MVNIEKNQKAWEKFLNKMNELRKRQLEILANFSKKLDTQKINKIMDKLKN